MSFYIVNGLFVVYLVKIYCGFMLLNLVACMKAGDCSVDVAFNSDVDVEATGADQQNLATLLASYRVTSPFRCISDCCEDDSCSAVTYAISSPVNCYQYSCEDHTCPIKATSDRYLYHLHPQLDSTTDITITIQADDDEVDQALGSGTNANLRTTLPPKPTKMRTPTSPSVPVVVSETTVTKSEAKSSQGRTSLKLATKDASAEASLSPIQHSIASTTARQIRTHSLPLFTTLKITNFKSNPEDTTNNATAVWTFRKSYGVLVTFAVFGFVILLAAVYVVVNRLNESLKRYRYKPYTKVEYLINDRRMLA